MGKLSDFVTKVFRNSEENYTVDIPQAVEMCEEPTFYELRKSLGAFELKRTDVLHDGKKIFYLTHVGTQNSFHLPESLLKFLFVKKKNLLDTDKIAEKARGDSH